MYKTIFSILIALSGLAGAAAPAPASVETKPLNQTMTKIGGVMIDLFPIIVTKGPLTQTQETKMGEDLNQLVELFREAGPYIKERSDTYQVSYQLVLDHLDKTKQAIDTKKFDYARKRLYSLGAICTSCHTQDTKLRTLFSGADRANFADDLAFAEFNYLTRNYTEAENGYDRFLRSDQPKTELELIQPLQRIITLYTQILNRPGEGAQKLSQYAQLPTHTPRTREHLAGWIAGLKELEANGASKVTHPSFSTLQNLVQKYIGPLGEPFPEIYLPPEQEVSRVWLRGLLYHYLNTHPNKTEIPKLLYWLAISDRSIGYNFYFSLADLYLKECVLNHASHPYAQRCFDEYNEFVNFTYSGSAGTFVPPEIEQELDVLEQALRKGKRNKK